MQYTANAIDIIIVAKYVRLVLTVTIMPYRLLTKAFGAIHLISVFFLFSLDVVNIGKLSKHTITHTYATVISANMNNGICLCINVKIE
jgi:hypothetical protein